jgi:hypothetical protein
MAQAGTSHQKDSHCGRAISRAAGASEMASETMNLIAERRAQARRELSSSRSCLMDKWYENETVRESRVHSEIMGPR